MSRVSSSFLSRNEIYPKHPKHRSSPLGSVRQSPCAECVCRQGLSLLPCFFGGTGPSALDVYRGTRCVIVVVYRRALNSPLIPLQDARGSRNRKSEEQEFALYFTTPNSRSPWIPLPSPPCSCRSRHQLLWTNPVPMFGPCSPFRVACPPSCRVPILPSIVQEQLLLSRRTTPGWSIALASPPHVLNHLPPPPRTVCSPYALCNRCTS